MEKREFKETITECLLEYGFIKKKKYFYLELPEVSLIAFLNSRYGNFVLCYNFSLNKIHDSSERKQGNPFDGYDSILIDTVDAKGDKFLSYKNLKRDELKQDIIERLERYFNPFFKDVENFLVDELDQRRIRNQGDNIILLKKIKEYLKDRLV